ncbi:hypothetical protein [Streptomyces indicus]|uniref:Uncharacterized protein n=1 Tax=Streptomyces indicus TaxID=417292 RepID=A0A1G9AB16_9ACTN|nr:hypothetical protein [Streptomyces indicus]SDK23785.1 hypothetical protein SAMN05421806_105434 [Streptomyces indicus]
MTIYSMHAHRGKTQILAMYQVDGGPVSSTVTSLGDSTLAAPIVDALNRISALATVPVSIHDCRDGRVAHYPTRHLSALTDEGSRAELLNGAHSLWYEYVCLELHHALMDLDDALADVPMPILIAINAELEKEARDLREALTEYAEAVPLPDSTMRRYWDHGRPFVTYGGGVDMLGHETREELDRLEEGLTSAERDQAVANLRVLVSAYARHSGDEATLEESGHSIFAEPYDSDDHFLTVNAPRPGKDGPDSWDIEISCWEPDDPEEEECSSATGRTVLRCTLPTTPSADEITDLLNQLQKEPTRLVQWAQTKAGATLAGTTFVVTRHHAD